MLSLLKHYQYVFRQWIPNCLLLNEPFHICRYGPCCSLQPAFLFLQPQAWWPSYAALFSPTSLTHVFFLKRLCHSHLSCLPCMLTYGQPWGLSPGFLFPFLAPVWEGYMSPSPQDNMDTCSDIWIPWDHHLSACVRDQRIWALNQYSLSRGAQCLLNHQMCRNSLYGSTFILAFQRRWNVLVVSPKNS